MGAALEALDGFVTAPGTTFTPLTMATGDSLTLRSATPGSQVRLLQIWGHAQADGRVRIRSPRLHDVSNGIVLANEAAQPQPLLPNFLQQLLQVQDVLTVEATGSATAGDIENYTLLIYYEDLPGIEAKFISPEELKTRMRNLYALQNTIASGTTGGWTGAEAINADNDQFKANTEYAIIGYLNSVLTATISYKGAFSGNLRIAGPGLVTPTTETRNWFIHLSENTGIPLIPVFNSNDKANVILECAQNEDGADPIVTTILAELSS